VVAAELVSEVAVIVLGKSLTPVEIMVVESAESPLS
jgi:uncharacterized protein YbcI